MDNLLFPVVLSEFQHQTDVLSEQITYALYRKIAFKDLKHLKSILENIFTSPPDSFFVGIINLKLNNGLYIGNGLAYIEAVYELIKSCFWLAIRQVYRPIKTYAIAFENEQVSYLQQSNLPTNALAMPGVRAKTTPHRPSLATGTRPI